MAKSKIFLQLGANLVGVTTKLHCCKESQFIIDTFLKSCEVSILFARDDCSHDDKKMFKIISRKMSCETSRELLISFFISTNVAQFSKAFETRMAVE